MKTLLILGLCLSLLPAQEAQVRQHLVRMFAADAPGCVAAVWHGGKLHGPWVRGLADVAKGSPLRADARFYLASVSKQFTAACAHVLVRRGKLDLDAGMGDHAGAAAGVKLRHLIDHSSGLRDHLSMLILQGRALERGGHARAARQLIERQPRLNHRPGTELVYTNTGYLLLADRIAAAAGMSLADFARQALFAPLELQQTRYLAGEEEAARAAVVGHRRSGQGFEVLRSRYAMVGPGGVVSTARDMLAWVQALDAGRLIDAEFCADLCRPRNKLANPDFGRYAAGWFVGDRRGYRLHWHPGGAVGFSTCVIWCRAEKFAVVVLCNREGGEAGRVARGITDLYLRPKPAAAVPAGAAMPRAGQYFFRHPDSGEVVYLAVRGRQTKVATRAFDVPMRPGAEGLVSTGSWVPVTARLDRGDLLLRIGAQPERRCKPIRPRRSSSEDRAGILGGWRAAALGGATLKFGAKGRFLELTGVPGVRDGRMMAVHPDLWMGDSGIGLEVERNDKGVPQRLLFHAPGLRGLQLRR